MSAVQVFHVSHQNEFNLIGILSREEKLSTETSVKKIQSIVFEKKGWNAESTEN